ncbi:circadian clock-controlled protein daywake-like [Epargyreus clarus]|uniref:circadian clock-controlled protein daywake-like n=1 Tax=Epargyreus clarus TaxID=520877 RepID=UPI003C2E96EE
MKLLLRVLYMGVFILVAKSSVLPVEKCHLDDSKCMLPAYQKMVPMFFAGMPEFGVKKLDSIDDVSFDISGLIFKLKNSSVKGLDSTIMDKVKWDLKKKTIDLQFHFDCVLEGDYTATGKILILPVDGDGKMKLKLKNLSINLKCHYDIEKKADGKEYVQFKNYSFDYDVKGNADYRMTNLFKGNKELSDNIGEFVNNNSIEITKEFGGYLLEKVAKQILKNCNSLFSTVAISDVAIL